MTTKAHDSQPMRPNPEVLTAVMHHPIRHLLLTLMEDGDNHTLADLAFSVGWPLSTVDRHLKALAEAGFVTELTDRNPVVPGDEYYTRAVTSVDQNAETHSPSHGIPRQYTPDAERTEDLVVEATMSPDQAVEFWACVEEFARRCSTSESAQLVKVHVEAHVTAAGPPDESADSLRRQPR